jgi:3-oxo-5alpha-steroid 4-dehydrogenase
LQATVSVYKDAAARGEDPSRHKKSEWLKPIGRPVGAIDLRASCAGFTLGALQTTLDAEVLHVSGEPVPGLYAAGRCTAGVATWGLRERHLTRRRQLYGRRAGGTAAKG